MPKWISIEKAAFKYGINEEVIWLWIEMNRFPVAYTKEPPAVDEEGMDDFFPLQQQFLILSTYNFGIQKTNLCFLHTQFF